jgi:hypothetical protein
MNRRFSLIGGAVGAAALVTGNGDGALQLW